MHPRPTRRRTTSSRRTTSLPARAQLRAGNDGQPGTVVLGKRPEPEPQPRRSTACYTYTPRLGASRPPPRSGVQFEERDLDADYDRQPDADRRPAQRRPGTQRQRAPGPTSWCATAASTCRRRCSCWTERLLLTAGLRAEQSSTNGDPNKFFFYPKVAAVLPAHPPLRRAGRAQGARWPTARRATSRSTARSSRPTPPAPSAGIFGVLPGNRAGDPYIRPERQTRVRGRLRRAARRRAGRGQAVRATSGHISDLLLEQTLARQLRAGDPHLQLRRQAAQPRRRGVAHRLAGPAPAT